jgi:hypothetical protein
MLVDDDDATLWHLIDKVVDYHSRTVIGPPAAPPS